MRITQQHIINFLLPCLSVLGLWVVYAMLEVNAIRGDEFLSFLHSDPRWTYSEIVQHIHGGADNSYVHAVLLRWAFGFFGHTIAVQRAVSMFGWLLGIILLYGVFNRKEKHTVICFLLVLIGFSNFGFFLATDGRFYSLLFCLATASLYVYFNRERWPVAASIGLFTVIQLLGLLTSANYIVFQLLFVAALIAAGIYTQGREFLLSTITWIGGTIISAVVYFTWFKIPSFHSYFLNGFFSEVSVCFSDIIRFASIPFRWIMIPHIPMCSDEVDVLVFTIAVLVFVGFTLKELKKNVEPVTGDSLIVGLMATGMVLALLIQIILYAVKGYPLWESRYYAPVFFVVPVALMVLLRNKLSHKVVILCSCLLILRLVAVEYPKIEVRKAVLVGLEQTRSEIMNQPQPALFVEQIKNNQSLMFVLMGNVYIRYPETRKKLYLMTDSALMARTIYFQRLSDWHYPLGLVFTADSSLYYKVPAKEE